MQGASVTFSLAGSGTAGAGAAGGGAAASAGATFLDGSTQATETTDAQGRAVSPLFTANQTPGSFDATASTPALRNPIMIPLDNLAGPPPRIRLLNAARRSATVETRYAHPLAVRVVGCHGAPLQGISVTFSLAGTSPGAAGAGNSGQASADATFLDGRTQATETTNAAGIAVSPGLEANDSPGVFTATASVTGDRNPASISLDNLAAPAPAVHPLGGLRRSASAGDHYATPLGVRVVDENGAPVQGATVTFTLGQATAAGGAGAGGGGAQAGAAFLDGSTSVAETTDASGVALSPVFSANTTAGTFLATASVAGVRNPVTFTLDNRAVRPPTIEPMHGPALAAVVGATFPHRLGVTVRDGDGTPVEGATVTFTVAGSVGSAAAGAGASFAGGGASAAETTNAAGRAVSPPLVANTVSGAFSVDASTSGTTALASFALHNLAAAPSSVTAGAAASEQTAPGTRFPIRLAVTVKDKDGNAVPNVPVTFSAPAAGASGRFASRRGSGARSAPRAHERVRDRGRADLRRRPQDGRVPRRGARRRRPCRRVRARERARRRAVTAVAALAPKKLERATSRASRASACGRAGCGLHSRRSGSRSASLPSSRYSVSRLPHRPDCSQRSTSSARISSPSRPVKPSSGQRPSCRSRHPG